MGELVFASFDSFRPRRPASSKEEEIVVSGDAHILFQIEMWARNKRSITENSARPLNPETRKNALEAWAILQNHPRSEP